MLLAGSGWIRMALIESPGRANRNLLLAALPAESLLTLERNLEIVEVPLGRVVFEAESANDVLFPLDAVLSLLREFEDGTAVEVGMVGQEGMAGVNAILGVDISSFAAVVQGRGIVGRMKGDVLRAHLQRDDAARQIFLRFVYVFTAATSQVAACNRLHVVTQRLAHWLLLLHDRVGSDEMSLTQEFLAIMLGTRRAGINAAIAELKGIGAIDHRRNRVIIADRQLLEQASCPCYAINVAEYERVFGFKPIARGRITPID